MVSPIGKSGLANPKHLALLKEGDEAWSAWRHQNPEVIPGLSKADLQGRKLPGFLARADLSGANLTGADLSESNLIRADMHGSNLVGAALRSADLRSADLSTANLTRAGMSGTNLCGANLRGSDLSESNLEGALFANTVFGQTCLKTVRGLQKCRFLSSCTIDLSTLELSWPLPQSFLRGCGLPDSFIEYIPSFLNEPIRFYSCFISYSSKDAGFATRLYEDLQDSGVRCWFAPEDIKIGEKLRVAINDAIRIRDKLLLVLSSNSIDSAWVESEVEAALEEERLRKTTVLFPIRLDESAMKCEAAWVSEVRRTRHIGDFRDWNNPGFYRRGLNRLLRDLKPGREP